MRFLWNLLKFIGAAYLFILAMLILMVVMSHFMLALLNN